MKGICFFLEKNFAHVICNAGGDYHKNIFQHNLLSFDASGLFPNFKIIFW
jgi:hypothetical protein